MRSSEAWLAGHWWRPDPSGPGMVHRASGEAVLYRGAAGEAGWHLFEYRYGTISYPLAVQVKTIEYPHPNPERFERKAQRFSFPDRILANIWLVDHGRSIAMRSSPSPVTYGNWCLADVAIREVALLWDETLSPVRRANEFSSREGFLNCVWHSALFRRYVWDEGIENYLAGVIGIEAIKQLPIAAFGQQITNRESPNWHCVPNLEFDGYGTTKRGETIGFINETNGMQIGIVHPVGEQSSNSTIEVIQCCLNNCTERAVMLFFSERCDMSAIERFRIPSSERWNAGVWNVSPADFSAGAFLRVSSDRKLASALTTSGHSDNQQGFEEKLQSKYRNLVLQLEAFEQLFPLCQPLSDHCCLSGFHPNSRQIDISSYPIGGKIAARASIRTSIKTSANAPLEEWVQTFGETI